ncbi:helix-turn-helix domain-containing protein [Cohnella hongkongensis]|uniref:Helix-turn-helix domain-containing protein n=1 Tax=Cohnella hongkongensis TaxID=178337 RepID=A0ABV9FLC9_9BACL
MDISLFCYHLTGFDFLTNWRELRSPVSSNRFTLIFISAGNGLIRIGNDSAAFGPMKLYWCKPGEEVVMHSITMEPVCVYRISFDFVPLSTARTGRDSEDDYRLINLWGTRELGLDAPSKAYRLVRDIASAFRKDVSNGFFKVQSLFYELLYMIADKNFAGSEQSARMEDVVSYVREHYADQLTRDKVAAMVGVHPDHFSRLFRKVTGRSFVDFVAEIRMSRASEQLLTSGDGLFEIARRVGYKDEFYFSRKFKQVVGTAPTVYRKKPKKAFTLGSNFTAGLLAVGHVPYIGSLTPWLKWRYRNVLQQGGFKPIYWDDCNIGALKDEPRPDVIVCHDKQYDPEQLERLREIAPTLSIPFGRMNWREQFIIVAELVNEVGKARAWLDRCDAAIDAARERIARKFDLIETLLILEVWSDELMVYGDTYGRAGHIMYRSIGFSPPAIVREQVLDGAGYKYIVKEQLVEYDADLVFLIVHDDQTSRRTASLLKRSPQWLALTAVKHGRVYEFDGGRFYGYDPASTEAQLQQIVSRL